MFDNLFKSIVKNRIATQSEIKGQEIINSMANNKNLVDGKPTHFYANSKYNGDIDIMKKCCDAEIEQMNCTGMVPAPYYFERVAILYRKEKNYEKEIEFCKMYIELIENYYNNSETRDAVDIRQGKTYKKIVDRLEKAKK